MTNVEKTMRSSLRRILGELEEQKGIVTPKDILDIARSEDSPIHGLFNWDDEIAGELYRLNQARALITDVKVEIQDKKIQKFYNVKIEINGEEKQGYKSVNNIINNEQMKNQIVQDAVSEIRYWQNKYNDITQLGNIINDEELNKIENEIKEK